MGDMWIVGEGLMRVAALGSKILLDSFGLQYFAGWDDMRWILERESVPKLLVFR